MRGTLLGDRYRVQNKIGEGGMAYVFVAHDEKLNRKVAIKILHRHMADNPDIRLRFFQEAQAISALDHPNILKIYDFSGESSQDLWMVTEILQGVNLAEYVQSFPGRWLHPVVAALIVREILKALEKAHQEGIVHRDVKPENIFVLNSGGIKLMDFGIAKNTRGNSITMTGTFMGSPSYMSPEQIRGKSVDSRSDIYSLGILFYEIITGKLPYTGTSTHDVVLRICEGIYKEPKHHVPNLPDDLNKIVIKAMAMYPSNRYQEAKSFSRDIDVFIKRSGFEESHVELERYFTDRERFSEKLRSLDYTNHASVHTTTLLDEEKRKRLADQRTKTRQQPITQPTQMLNPMDAMRQRQGVMNNAALERPISNASGAYERPAAASGDATKGSRRDHALPRFKSDTRLLKKKNSARKASSRRVHRPVAPVIYRVAVRRRSHSSSFLSGLFKVILWCSAIAALAYYVVTNTSTLVKPKRSHPTRAVMGENPRPVLLRPSVTTSTAAPTVDDRDPVGKAVAPTNRPKTIRRATNVKSNKNLTPAIASVTSSISNSSSTSTTKTQSSTAQPKPSVVPATPIAKNPVSSTPVKLVPPEFKISSRPASEIYINGERRGTTIDQTLSSGWIKLTRGSHRIELRRTGYRSYKINLKLNDGDRRAIDTISLEPDSNYLVTLNANVKSVSVQIINLSTNEQKFLILGSGSQQHSMNAGRYRLRFQYQDQVIERHLVLSGADSVRSLGVNFRTAGGAAP